MLSFVDDLKKAPFIKIVIPLILGITCQLHFIISLQISLILLLTALALLIFLSLSHLVGNYNYQFYWGIGFYLFLFYTGIYITACKMETIKIPGNLAGSHEFILKINDIPVVNEKTTRTTANIVAYKSNYDWKSCDYKCNLYVYHNNYSDRIGVGDKLLVDSEIREIDSPISPYQFDYKRYLYYKGILIRLSVKTNQYKKLSIKSNNFYILLLKFRQFLLSKFDNSNISRREKAVLSSLVLGFTGNLDPELKNSYAVAGVMHILSVSGMHVGIVYCFLLYLLFFMEKTQKLRVIRSVIIIIGLWIYALITGFSPPVIRSALMFTFFAIGQSVNRNYSEFNILAVSAFIILLCNPFQINDLGFQLSYSAMAGIILFYKPLYYKWNPTNFFIDKIWQLVAVSFAAQLGTLPLSLYYFHKFPTYFILANLFIVPLSGYIIYAGLALLIFSFLPYVVSIISQILNYLLTALNWMVIHIEFLPYASIQGIYIDLFQVIAISVIICALAGWLKYYNKTYIFIFLIFCLAFVSVRAYRNILYTTQKKLVVHNIPGHTAISIICKYDWFLLSDSSAIPRINKASENMQLNFNLKKQHTLSFNIIERDTAINNFIIYPFSGKNFFIILNNKRIILLNDIKILNFNCKKPLTVDYLILSNKINISINMALNYFKPSRIIINSFYRHSIKNTLNEGSKLNIPIIFIKEQGTYIAEL